MQIGQNAKLSQHSRCKWESVLINLANKISMGRIKRRLRFKTKSNGAYFECKARRDDWTTHWMTRDPNGESSWVRCANICSINFVINFAIAYCVMCVCARQTWDYQIENGSQLNCNVAFVSTECLWMTMSYWVYLWCRLDFAVLHS